MTSSSSDFRLSTTSRSLSWFSGALTTPHEQYSAGVRVARTASSTVTAGPGARSGVFGGQYLESGARWMNSGVPWSVQHCSRASTGGTKVENGDRGPKVRLRHISRASVVGPGLKNGDDLKPLSGSL